MSLWIRMSVQSLTFCQAHLVWGRTQSRQQACNYKPPTTQKHDLVNGLQGLLDRKSVEVLKNTVVVLENTVVVLENTVVVKKHRCK